MILDAHQHFWRFDPVRDSWISDQMAVLRRDFLPEDLEPLLIASGMEGCIAVQADQSDTETGFLLDLAAKHAFIKGVVGWVDLRTADLESTLDSWSEHRKLRGFRHILQGEKPEFMLQSDFLRGIRTLGKRGYSYDILVFPRHLSAVKTFLKHFDQQAFIIDHLAKPYIKKRLIKQWTRDIRAIARHDNVYCKVSGLVTEADWSNWKATDFGPYLDIAFETFGPSRLLYGSDWPVCLLATGYVRQKVMLEEYLSPFSPAEKAGFWGENACRAYVL